MSDRRLHLEQNGRGTEKQSPHELERVRGATLTGRYIQPARRGLWNRSGPGGGAGRGDRCGGGPGRELREGTGVVMRTTPGSSEAPFLIEEERHEYDLGTGVDPHHAPGIPFASDAKRLLEEAEDLPRVPRRIRAFLPSEAFGLSHQPEHHHDVLTMRRMIAGLLFAWEKQRPDIADKTALVNILEQTAPRIHARFCPDTVFLHLELSVGVGELVKELAAQGLQLFTALGMSRSTGEVPADIEAGKRQEDVHGVLEDDRTHFRRQELERLGAQNLRQIRVGRGNEGPNDEAGGDEEERGGECETEELEHARTPM